MSLEDRLLELENIRAALFAQLGIGELKPKSEVQKYLTLGESELKAITPESCVIGAHLLASESTYIQTQINRHQRIYNWANRNLSQIIAKVVDNYGTQYTPYEIKKARAINDDMALHKFAQLASDTELVLDSLAFIPQNLKFQAQTLLSLAQSKQRQ